MSHSEHATSSIGVAARTLVKQRSHGMCEAQIREACLGRAGNFHHRQPAGMGGTTRVDSPALLLHLCGSGTTGCHGWIERNRARAKLAGWLVSQFENDVAAVPVLWRLRRVVLDEKGGMRPVAGEAAPGRSDPD